MQRIQEAPTSSLSNSLSQRESEAEQLALSIDDEWLAEPTGEGLSQREARRLLVEEMNGLVNARNQRRLSVYAKRLNKWDRTGKGIPPQQPPIIKGYNMKRLNQAVCSARRKGIYKELLANAGF
jgi:hypothetical protein